MPNGAPPNQSTTLIGDAEEAVHAFSMAGYDARFDRLRDRSAFSIDFKPFPIGGAELVRTIWGTDTWLRIEMADQVAVAFNLPGSAPSEFSVPGESVPVSARSAMIGQPGETISIFRAAHAPMLALSADLKELERLFREVSGTDSGGLKFAPSLDLDTPEGRRFQRAINYAFNELQEDPSAIDNPIIRRQLDDFILCALLSLPGDHHRLLDNRSGSAGSAVVRRAEEFMEANVGRPICMSDVAAESGCSRTKLFQAFRQEREWTPLQFLVRRRMEHARRRLLTPSANLTITAVALDCGYANFSRFAQEYRKFFGEAPSTTLHRGR